MIDYHEERPAARQGELDVVFDTVGGRALSRSWDLLKPDGRMVTIAANSEGTKDERIEKAFCIVEPIAKQLAEVALLLDSNHRKCSVDTVVPLEKASDAYTGSIQGKRGRGKIVVSGVQI